MLWPKPMSDLELARTAEFHDAVRAEVALATEKMRAEFTGLFAQVRAGAPATADAGWMQALAMELATLTDQGIGAGARIAPDVVRKRDQARKRMTELIAKARAEGRIPSYKLIHKTHLDFELVNPMWVGADHVARPTEIDWQGVPNEAMIPLNDTAKEIYAAFAESIGNATADNESGSVPLKTTRGGLVVRGRPRAAARETGINYDGTTMEQHKQAEDGGGLRLKHRGSAGYKEINVLGTIHAPALEQI